MQAVGRGYVEGVGVGGRCMVEVYLRQARQWFHTQPYRGMSWDDKIVGCPVKQRTYLWWSLCTLHLHACQVEITVTTRVFVVVFV